MSTKFVVTGVEFAGWEEFDTLEDALDWIQSRHPRITINVVQVRLDKWQAEVGALVYNILWGVE